MNCKIVKYWKFALVLEILSIYISTIECYTVSSETFTFFFLLFYEAGVTWDKLDESSIRFNSQEKKN